MNAIPKISHVLPEPSFQLLIAFENGEVRRFNVRPYMESAFFAELSDPAYFRQVSIVSGGGGIEWPNEQDFSRDTLYLKSDFEKSWSLASRQSSHIIGKRKSMRSAASKKSGTFKEVASATEKRPTSGNISKGSVGTAVQGKDKSKRSKKSQSKKSRKR